MNKGISEFLRDTSIYDTEYPTLERAKCMELIHAALAEISTNILDLGQEPPVKVLIDDQAYRITLGKLGKYRIQASPENLSKLSQRLY